MPLYRRLPKRGFNNKWAKEYAEVNVKDLNRFEDGTEVDLGVLLAAGLVGKQLDGLKVLGNGELSKKPRSSQLRLRSSARALSKRSKRQAERQRSSNGTCEDIL